VNADSPTILRVHLLNGSGQKVLIVVGERYLHALIRGMQSQGQPDATGRSGDDGDLTCQVTLRCRGRNVTHFCKSPGWMRR
jgi:hypothetical protein